MEQESKPQLKQPQPPTPLSRVSAASENNQSVNGKARPSTTSTRASTAKSSLERVPGEQNLEGLGGNVEPIPRKPNNVTSAFMEQEFTPKQHQLQPQPPSCVHPQWAEVILLASGASGRGTPSFRATKTAPVNKAGKAKRPEKTVKVKDEVKGEQDEKEMEEDQEEDQEDRKGREGQEDRGPQEWVDDQDYR